MCNRARKENAENEYKWKNMNYCMQLWYLLTFDISCLHKVIVLEVLTEGEEHLVETSYVVVISTQ